MNRDKDIIKNFVAGLKENYSSDEVNDRITEIRNILNNKSIPASNLVDDKEITTQNSIKDQELRKIRKLLNRNN